MDIRSQILMFSQQLQFLHCSTAKLIERIKSLPELTQFALIIHDQDRTASGEPVVPHLHAVLCFNKRVRIAQVAKKMNQKVQYFESMTKRGTNIEVSKNNALAYLIHETTQARNQGKYRYNPEDVIANFNYPNYIKKIQVQTFDSPKQIIKDFNNNQISKIEAIKKIKNSNSLNIPKYLNVINKIDEINKTIKQAKWIQEHEKNHKPITIIWIFGASGLGKTEFAKHIATKLSPNNKFDFTGSSKDVFQDIEMQPTLIIDEIRPKDIKFNDLLKLLDNYNYRKNAPARYNDKHIVADTIIITSPSSPIEFYESYKLAKSDKFFQLARRISITLELTKTKINELKLITTNLYDPTIDEKTEAIQLPNNKIFTYKVIRTTPNTYTHENDNNNQITLLDLI